MLDRLETLPLDALMQEAAALRDAAHGRVISYSRKVFIPLTKLCRDVCHYCTFAETPRAGHAAYLSAEEVLAIARAGAAAGCTDSRRIFQSSYISPCAPSMLTFCVSRKPRR